MSFVICPIHGLKLLNWCPDCESERKWGRLVEKHNKDIITFVNVRKTCENFSCRDSINCCTESGLVCAPQLCPKIEAYNTDQDMR